MRKQQIHTKENQKKLRFVFDKPKKCAILWVEQVKPNKRKENRMKKYLCSIVVEIDEEKLNFLGYANAEDYLNECCFSVIDDEKDDICVEVREYDEIGG